MNELVLSNAETYNRDLIEFLNDKEEHFIDKFLKVKALKSENTAISYRTAYKQFFNKEINCITIEDIRKVTYYDCFNFLKKLEEAKAAPSTINEKIAALSSLYKWLLKFNSQTMQIIQINPFELLKEEKPKVVSEESEYLTEKEMHKVLVIIPENNIKDLRDKIILSLAFTTALRKSDIKKIKIKDIQEIELAETIYIIKIPISKKTKNSHTVKLQKKIKVLIDKYIEMTGRNYEEDREDYLFKGRSLEPGAQLADNTFNVIVKKRIANANINKHLKVHGTRHSALTAMLDRGVPIQIVQKQANHKSINTTMRYIHSKISLENNPTDKINIL